MSFPYRIVDLTHTLTAQTPSWSGGCGYKPEINLDYDQCDTDIKFRVQQVKMHCGIGTHIDAPAHCVLGGATVDTLNLNDLCAPLIVVDVSSKMHERYTVSIEDLQFPTVSFKNAFFLIKTGWGRFWNTPARYHNNHTFPSVSGDAAKFLVEQGIKGLGIDTMSPDRPEDGFPVHDAILGSGQYIVENVLIPDDLPFWGSYIMALPAKLCGCTEAPVRLVALL
jgi:kynurenine formamidase